MDDAEFAERTQSLINAIDSDDDLEVAEALLRYVANELEGNRCAKCQASKLRAGETASLVLRMQKLNEEVQAGRKARSKKVVDPNNLPEGVTALERIRLSKQSGTDSGDSDPELDVTANLGTKSGPRKQNGRQSRFKSSGS